MVSSWNPQSPLTSRLKAVDGSTNKFINSWKKSFNLYVAEALTLCHSNKPLISDSISDSSSTQQVLFSVPKTHTRMETSEIGEVFSKVF